MLIGQNPSLLLLTGTRRDGTERLNTLHALLAVDAIALQSIVARAMQEKSRGLRLHGLTNSQLMVVHGELECCASSVHLTREHEAPAKCIPNPLYAPSPWTSFADMLARFQDPFRCRASPVRFLVALYCWQHELHRVSADSLKRIRIRDIDEHISTSDSKARVVHGTSLPKLEFSHPFPSLSTFSYAASIPGLCKFLLRPSKHTSSWVAKSTDAASKHG